jgi:hypothetical protein
MVNCMLLLSWGFWSWVFSEQGTYRKPSIDQRLRARGLKPQRISSTSTAVGCLRSFVILSNVWGYHRGAKLRQCLGGHFSTLDNIPSVVCGVIVRVRQQFADSRPECKAQNTGLAESLSNVLIEEIFRRQKAAHGEALGGCHHFRLLSGCSLRIN